jgi:hypothetical protein
VPKKSSRIWVGPLIQETSGLSEKLRRVFADGMSEVSDKEARDIYELVTILATKNDYFIYQSIVHGYARLIRQPQRSLSLAKRVELGKMLEGTKQRCVAKETDSTGNHPLRSSMKN